jgi:hypothetical protein
VTLTTALPDIASDLVINGGGSVTLDIAGHGRVTETGGAVTLKGLTILNGSTGAIRYATARRARSRSSSWARRDGRGSTSTRSSSCGSRPRQPRPTLVRHARPAAIINNGRGRSAPSAP